MKKQHTILALLLVCAVLIANLVPVKADEAVRFTSIKGVDYIQLRENTTDEFGSQTAYNYDLQLLNDGTLNNAYTASQTNPFTTGSLESINAAWSNVTAAYCLEHSLGYPHGTDPAQPYLYSRRFCLLSDRKLRWFLILRRRLLLCSR